jgi:hypothetical protein
VTNNKRRLVSTLKTLPGALLAAFGTAVVGALVAYFAPSALDRLTGEDRLQVRLETNPATIDTFSALSQHALVPRGQHVSGDPGPGCAGFYPWVSAFGGVPAGETNFRVIAQGGGDQTLISGIRARVTERNQPLSGTGFLCPSQAGLKVRSVALDLDEPNPTGQVVEYGTGEVVEKGKGRPVAFTVSEDETEVFDISATTEECYCEWILELVTTQDGDQEIISVPEGGSPFETTAWPRRRSATRARAASEGRPYYLWDPFQSSWSISRPSGDTEYPADTTELPELSTFTPRVRGGPLFHP